MESLPAIEETPSTAFEDYSIMCNLPNEILNHIFAFLQVEDRKSVRLVCRLWYHCSTCSRITAREKFVFRIPSNIEDITKTMLKSNFSILNLEFQGLPVNSLPINVWEECGNRIYTLEFYECQWEDETIESVILHCVNLISLTFSVCTHGYVESYCSSSTRVILRSPQLLDKMIEKGVQRPKLRTFNVFTRDNYSFSEIAEKIFHIYPCIRNFAVRTLFCNLIFCFPTLMESLEFTDPPSAASFVEEDDSSDDDLIQACIAKGEQGLRLKHFYGVFRETELSSGKEKLLNFFSSQKILNAIKLELLGIDSESAKAHGKEIFFDILKSCPSLQEFRFALTPLFLLNLERSECPKFLTSISKLQSLHLGLCVIDYDDPSISSESPLPSVLTPSKNLVLTKLELDLVVESPDDSDLGDRLCAALIQHCPLLLHLKLNFPSDGTLQIIFNNLLKLQTLILCFNNSNLHHSHHGYNLEHYHASVADGYPIKQLQQLKCLSITDNHCFRTTKTFAAGTVLEIKLPHLEFLELNMYFFMSLEEELIHNLASQIPKLKVLSLRTNDYEKLVESFGFCKIINFCKYLRNLHRIESGLYLLDDKMIKEVFRVCPSLRYISGYLYVFFFDPFTNNIQRRNVGDFKFEKNHVFDPDYFT